jgi:hypothetical protein
MATISITVPEPLIPRIVAAARNEFPQYAGLSETEAFKRITADYWRGILARYEADLAINTAMQDATGIE